MIKDTLPRKVIFDNEDRDNILTMMTYFEQMSALLRNVYMIYDGRELNDQQRRVFNDVREINEKIDRRLYKIR